MESNALMYDLSDRPVDSKRTKHDSNPADAESYSTEMDSLTQKNSQFKNYEEIQRLRKQDQLKRLLQHVDDHPETQDSDAPGDGPTSPTENV